MVLHVSLFLKQHNIVNQIGGLNQLVVFSQCISLVYRLQKYTSGYKYAMPSPGMLLVFSRPNKTASKRYIYMQAFLSERLMVSGRNLVRIEWELFWHQE